MIREAATLAALLALAGPVFADCDPARVDLKGDWGSARFSVELADDPQERSLGLMNRETMPRSAGMLFVYEQPQRAVFWMKNTLIPLDMLFVAEDGTIEKIAERVPPRSLETVESDGPARAVLEINGGLSEQLGITPGSKVLYKAFGTGLEQ